MMTISHNKMQSTKRDRMHKKNVYLCSNVSLFHKSTTSFHGLHSYRPYKLQLKCSKLEWKHKPFGYYGIVSMGYKSEDHKKIWSICLIQ